MPTISDDKFAALRALGFTGALNDMTLAWLKSKGATANTINDAWHQIFNLMEAPAGSLSDRLFAWYRSLGYVGSMSDMEAQYWADSGGVGAGLILGPEIITNGKFDSGASWSPGAGWAITGGKAVATAAAVGVPLQQVRGIGPATYRTQYTISGYTAGSVFLRVYGSGLSDCSARNSNGTFVQNLVVTNSPFSTGFRFVPSVSAFSGSIDDVSVRWIVGT